MSDNSSNSEGGMDLCDTIFIVFLILKLFGIINISWLWVFSPLIIGVIFLILIEKSKL